MAREGGVKLAKGQEGKEGKGEAGHEKLTQEDSPVAAKLGKNN